MTEKFDFVTLMLIGTVLVLLGTATWVARFLRRRADGAINIDVLETFRLRIGAWWLLVTILAAAFLIGKGIVATVVLFGMMSFWALREFITLTPTRPGDHRTLSLVFFVCTPAQFVLVGYENYDLYTTLIPVYAFLLIPAGIALAGDYKRYLERVAKIEAGLLICVYCLSYAPALMTLNLPGAEEDPGANARLLLFFILMCQLSDVLQYGWAQLPSKHPIVPSINPNKTWEGLLGGCASVALAGAALSWSTPFSPLAAGMLSVVIALMGFAGSITMSAIKRDRKVKDYGTLIEGHGGVLDRIDSICFAAPVFFHLTRWSLEIAV